MHRLMVGLFAVLVATSTNITGAKAQEHILAFTHVNVIDATGTPVKADATVVLRGPQIALVGKSSDVKVPSRAQVIEGRGKYLIPGLWDMHVHEIFGAWLTQMFPSDTGDFRAYP